MQVMRVAKNLAGKISKNSPTILTVVAVTGLLSSVILAVKATPKALELLEEENDRRWKEIANYDEPKLLTPIDIVKLAWRCYAPTAGIVLATGACIIGANSINQKRLAALATVYTLSETAFKEYRSKVVETLGKNKEQKLRDEIAEDRAKANPPGPNEIILTGKGDVKCYESLSRKYFRSDYEQIRRSINNLNDQLFRQDFVSMNDMLYELGVSGVKGYDDIGWSPMGTGTIKPQFSTHLSDNGEPCLVLGFEVEPRFM